MVDLEIDVIYPLLLELYSDYSDGVLSKQDFIPIIHLTESYIFRRAVCGLGTNSKQSPLKLNQSLKDLESFSEEEIEKRASDLADWALKIWTYPKLDAETLEKYKPKKEKKVYDLSFYKFSSNSRELFDILRKEIKALDEKIAESFTKAYITYKFDTIFTSIVPSKDELTLMLKIEFSELQDGIKEKLKIRDVSNIGHSCVGNIEVKLETKEDIPYCLGLIKQALEKQMSGKNRQ
ncbi:hypothetical protein MMM130_13000 [Helicobacter pylori]